MSGVGLCGRVVDLRHRLQQHARRITDAIRLPHASRSMAENRVLHVERHLGSTKAALDGRGYNPDSHAERDGQPAVDMFDAGPDAHGADTPDRLQLDPAAGYVHHHQVAEMETGHQIAVRALVTLYSGRTAFAKAVADDIRHHLSGRHFDTVIRYSVKLGEAASHGIPIAHYCQRCAGFEDYEALATEVLQQEAAIEGHAVLGIADDHYAGPLTPVVTSTEVVFVIEARHAAHVQVMGDFNDWNLDGSEMEPGDGIWKKVVNLPASRGGRSAFLARLSPVGRPSALMVGDTVACCSGGSMACAQRAFFPFLIQPRA